MSTSVQLGFDIGEGAQQMQMLGEFQGKDGRKDKLIDVDGIKRRKAAAPLPGQVALTVQTQPEPVAPAFAAKVMNTWKEL